MACKSLLFEYICYEITIDLFSEEESITQDEDVHTLPTVFTQRGPTNRQTDRTTVLTGLCKLKIKTGLDAARLHDESFQQNAARKTHVVILDYLIFKPHHLDR